MKISSSAQIAAANAVTGNVMMVLPIVQPS